MKRSSRPWTARVLACVVVLGFAGSAYADQAEEADAYARTLFRRLTGVPILLSDPRLAEMRDLVVAGDLAGAATIATDDDHFYHNTLRQVASVMTNVDASPLVPFNDFEAMFLGLARDNIDARELLTGDVRYVLNDPYLPAYSAASNDHYAQADAQSLNLRSLLARVIGQAQDFAEAAGVLTLRTWANTHYSAGTNRRPVSFAFSEFLCAPQKTWRDAAASDAWVRRDVSRAPGGVPATYQNDCRGCHAPMDAMSGAFARLDFVNGAIRYYAKKVAPKYLQNSSVYPEGYVPVDDSWVNLAVLNQNSKFGWRGATDGSGIKEFGQMLANSVAFSQCMARRAFHQVCGYEPGLEQAEELGRLAQGFEESGYLLRELFEQVAISPVCLEAPKAEIAGKGLQVKNFKELYSAYSVVTNVSLKDPVVHETYLSARTRLPKYGDVEEVSSPMLMAVSALGGAFCQQMIEFDAKRDPVLRWAHKGFDFSPDKVVASEQQRRAVIDTYAELFWQRSPTPEEEQSLLTAMGNDATKPLTLAARKQLLMVACSAVASSFEFILN